VVRAQAPLSRLPVPICLANLSGRSRWRPGLISGINACVCVNPEPRQDGPRGGQGSNSSSSSSPSPRTAVGHSAEQRSEHSLNLFQIKPPRLSESRLFFSRPGTSEQTIETEGQQTLVLFVLSLWASGTNPLVVSCSLSCGLDSRNNQPQPLSSQPTDPVRSAEQAPVHCHGSAQLGFGGARLPSQFERDPDQSPT
jgi:hypothetical protein